MKTAVFLLGLFVASVAADIQCPLQDAIVQGFRECAIMTDASIQTIRNVKSGRGIHDEDTNCLRACMMDEAGLMTNGKIDVVKMENMLPSCDQLSRLYFRIFISVARMCNKYVEVSEDECQTAHNYMRCFTSARSAFKYAKTKDAAARRAEAQVVSKKTY